MTSIDHLITKATVILAQPTDWNKWIFLRKDSAEKNQLWKYVDPSKMTEEIPRLADEEPKKKTADDFKKEGREAGTVYGIEDLSDSEYRKYSGWRSEYVAEKAIFDKKEAALRQFNSEIAQTITDIIVTIKGTFNMTTEHRLHYIMKLDSPHERLRKLNAELSPSTFEQESILLQQYHEIKKYPKQANVSDWLDRYEALIELMEEAKLAEVSGARAQAEFLLCVQGGDDSWATAQRIKLIKKQRTANDFTSIRDLIQEYRLWWRQTKPVAASLSSFAGTLGDNMNTRSYQDARYNCPCGASHRF
ncbi:hypothetical protein EJ04DRAFT_455317, partial [Polyplosphaeria fusca]